MSAELRYTAHWDDLTLVVESCSDQMASIGYHRKDEVLQEYSDTLLIFIGTDGAPLVPKGVIEIMPTPQATE